MTQAEQVNFEKYLDEQWASILKKSRETKESDRYYYMGLTQALRLLGYNVERRTDGVHFISDARKSRELKYGDLKYPLNLISDILNEKQETEPTRTAVNQLTVTLNSLHPKKKVLLLMYYLDGKPLFMISKEKDIPVSHIREILIDCIKTLRKNQDLCKALRGGINTEVTLPDISDKHYVQESDLSGRIKNCLLRAGIHTFEDLNGRSWRQLSRIRGFGNGCRAELEKHIKEYNITVKD